MLAVPKQALVKRGSLVKATKKQLPASSREKISRRKVTVVQNSKNIQIKLQNSINNLFPSIIFSSLFFQNNEPHSGENFFKFQKWFQISHTFSGKKKLKGNGGKIVPLEFNNLELASACSENKESEVWMHFKYFKLSDGICMARRWTISNTLPNGSGTWSSHVDIWLYPGRKMAENYLVEQINEQINSNEPELRKPSDEELQECWMMSFAESEPPSSPPLSVVEEVKKFLAVRLDKFNIFTFWRERKHEFPRLAQLFPISCLISKYLLWLRTTLFARYSSLLLLKENWWEMKQLKGSFFFTST